MINNKPLPFLIAALIFLSNPAVAKDTDWPKIDLLAVNPGDFISETVKVKKDPVFQQDREYEGFLLSQVLQKFKYPESYQDTDLLLVFTAQDGYKVSMSLADARQKKGYIAYQDNATSLQINGIHLSLANR